MNQERIGEPSITEMSQGLVGLIVFLMMIFPWELALQESRKGETVPQKFLPLLVL